MNKKWILFFLFFSGLTPIIGCTPKAVVSELPLKRAVLYRNGIGYFERIGTIQSQSLIFKVRKEYLNDFLGSLALATRDVTVKGISFKTDEEGMVTVKIDFLEKDIDSKIKVSYTIETPIWRPSYRVIFNGDKPVLQAWAVVQNISGEDWNEIHLTLTTGTPLTFKTELSTPIIPPRYTLTDEGEIIMGVVQGETQLHEEEKVEKATLEPAAKEEAIEDYYEEEELTPMRMAPTLQPQKWRQPQKRSLPKRTIQERPKKAEVMPKGLPEAELPPPEKPLSYSTAIYSMAKVEEEKGVSTYVISNPINVPNNSSAMVAIMNIDIEAEDSYLYRPDPAVQDSSKHPFRVVRLKNTTGSYLEKGSLMVYSKGTLIGQGVLGPLPKLASTTVPIALDRNVRVDILTKYTYSPLKLIKIVNGVVTIEETSIKKTNYKIVNGKNEPIKIYIKHERTTNWKVEQPEKKQLEEVDGGYLIPQEIPSFASKELAVVESSPIRRSVEILSMEAMRAINNYLSITNIPENIRNKLKEIIDKQEKLFSIEKEITKLEEELNTTKEMAEEIRESLKAIEKNPKAEKLRQKLTKKLNEVISKEETLSTKIIDLRNSENELKIELSETIREITIDNETNS